MLLGPLLLVTGALLLVSRGSFSAAPGAAAVTPTTNAPTRTTRDDIAVVPDKDLERSEDPAFLYRRDCATCHGADGRGSDKAPSLVGAGRAGIYYWVSTGRMPLPDLAAPVVRREPRYRPAVVDRMVDYITELTGGGGPDIPAVGHGDAAHGGELFSLECSACHAWSGQGSVIDTGDVPEVSSANERQIASAVRIGPGEMPAFGRSALTPEELDDLVAFTHGLRRPDDRGGFGLWHRGPVLEGAASLVLGLGALLLAIGWIGAKARAKARG